MEEFLGCQYQEKGHRQDGQSNRWRRGLNLEIPRTPNLMAAIRGRLKARRVVKDKPRH